jgi:hypothetical protein
MFSLSNNLYFYIIAILLSISYPLAIFIERISPNKVSRAFYAIAATWVGVLFLLFFVILAYIILSLFIHLPKLLSGEIIISLVVILTIYGLINGLFLKVRKITIPIEKLKKELKIVQLTDLHLGTIKNSSFFKKVINITNKLSPDLVVITGDLVDESAPLHKGMIKEINKVKAPIYFVTGNHEIYENVEKVLSIVKETKIRYLNGVVLFKDIQIIGIDYSESKDKKEIFNKLQRLNLEKPSILLYHAPLSLKELNKAKVSIHLAGHTHNGQVFPFNLFARLAFKHISGLHKLNETYQYISSGTGLWGPPMRIGSSNEITLIKLIKK